MISIQREGRLVRVFPAGARERADRGLAERAALPAVARPELELGQFRLTLHHVERAEQGGCIDAVEWEFCLRGFVVVSVGMLPSIPAPVHRALSDRFAMPVSAGQQ
jgi:hypothetical protein